MGDTQESKLGLREDVINGKKVYSLVAKTTDKVGRPATYSISLSYPENTNFNQDEVKKINAKLTEINEGMIESSMGERKVLSNLNIKRADGTKGSLASNPSTYMKYVKGGKIVTMDGFRYKRDKEVDADIAADPVKISELSKEITDLKTRLKDSKAELKDLQSEIKTEKVKEVKQSEKDTILEGLEGEHRKLAQSFIKKIERASNKIELQKIAGEILLTTDTFGGGVGIMLTDTTSSKLNKLITERTSEISTGSIAGVAGEAVNIGDNLVVINTDKGRDGTKANDIYLPIGTVVKVVKTSENSVTLNAGVGTNSMEYEVSFDKLKKTYDLQDTIDNMETKEQEMNEQDKEFVDQSIGEVAEFAGNEDAVVKIEDSAEDSTGEDADNDLLDENLSCE